MPTHRAMACKKVDIIPIEVVVRNVAAGSIVRQTTLEEGHIINWPLVEWFLKDDEKDDPLLTVDRINLMGDYPLKELEYLAREVNAILKSIFDQIGLTLVDFKLEFGYDTDKNLLLADELSPDGMRLWKKGTKERFDKDLFRKDEGDIVEAYKYILQELRRFS
jgi:phosphoribosylaminoimidazole-succinocarboxamide synthase